MIIIKFILNLSLVFFYLIVNENKNLKEFKTNDLISITLTLVIIVLSLIEQISIFINIILIILITFSNYLYSYYSKSKIKINYEGSNMHINNNIIDVLENIRIKTLKNILKRYNL